jgi:hypothetical protein
MMGQAFFIIIIINFLNIIYLVYKLIYSQADQSGHCAAYHAYPGVYLRHFKHLKNDRKPASHQVSVFCVFGVGFHFSYAANIRIIMILYDFCLFPACCDVSRVLFASLYVGLPWNVEMALGNATSSAVTSHVAVNRNFFLGKCILFRTLQRVNNNNNNTYLRMRIGCRASRHAEMCCSVHKQYGCIVDRFLNTYVKSQFNVRKYNVVRTCNLIRSSKTVIANWQQDPHPGRRKLEK